MKSSLAECRDRFEPRGIHGLLRRIGVARPPRFAAVCAGDKAAPKALPHYQALLDGGRVVWGAIVQANPRAFLAGTDDLPAVVAFSPDSFFDDAPDRLQEIAHRVFALKGQTPAATDLARIAGLISDEHADYYHERVPDSLTDGREVSISTFQVNRRRLPTGRLSFSLFPLLVDAARAPVVMILPLRYWGRSLVDHWRAAGAEPGAAGARGAAPEPDAPKPLSSAEAELARRAYVENPLRLTSEAAARVRQIIAECDLPSGAYLRVFTTRSERSMKFSVDPPDAARDVRLRSEGFEVVTDVDSAMNLSGVVLDLRDGIEGSGFLFRDA